MISVSSIIPAGYRFLLDLTLPSRICYPVDSILIIPLNHTSKVS